jgi:hypothetical protein
VVEDVDVGAPVHDGDLLDGTFVSGMHRQEGRGAIARGAAMLACDRYVGESNYP